MADAGEYLDILRKDASVGMIDPSIRSSMRYTDALIRGLQAALSGKDPEAALDDVAAEWDQITQQVGVEKQREAYRRLGIEAGCISLIRGDGGGRRASAAAAALVFRPTAAFAGSPLRRRWRFCCSSACSRSPTTS